MYLFAVRKTWTLQFVLIVDVIQDFVFAYIRFQLPSNELKILKRPSITEETVSHQSGGSKNSRELLSRKFGLAKGSNPN